MNWRRLIHCAGGLRCANVQCAPLPEGLPPGTALHFEYTCGACGTHYHWNSATGKRKRVGKITNPSGFTLAPGETAVFDFEIPEKR